MNVKTLYALIAATVIAVALALWVKRANKPLSEDSEAQNQPLVPDLRDRLNDVAEVTLASGGKVWTTLKRDGDEWRIVEKSNYPADVAKLREFLFKVADATVLEKKTSNPQHYVELGVEDPDKCSAAPTANETKSAADCKGMLVTLDGLKQPVKLIVGVYNGAGGGGTFVRNADEVQSLLVKGNLLTEKNPGSWIRHDVLDIDSARIKEVVFIAPGAQKLRVYKDQPADDGFKVADVPKGRELASDFVANSLGSGLSNLRADDVAPAKNAPPSDKVYKIHYLGFDGVAYDVIAWEANSKDLMQIVASSDAVQIEAAIVAEQAKAKGAYETAIAAAKLKVVEGKGDDAAMAKAQADVAKPPSLVDPAKHRSEREAATAKTVEDLNKRLGGWTFTVPAYTFSNFNRGMDDLLKPLLGKPAPALKPGAVPQPGAMLSLPVPASSH